MESKFTQVWLTSAALALFTGAITPVIAAPTVDVQQYSALLGSPVLQIPVKDPLLKKAIELIQERPLKPLETPKKNKSDSPIGGTSPIDNDKVLILGGPETVPM